MIYLVIAAVLGFAAWQLFAVIRRTRQGSCASGCSGCSSKGSCSVQQPDLIQLEQ